MAIKLDAGEVGRGDIFSISPEHLLYAADLNSRVVPHTDEEIEALAKSIVENGQLQPVLARRVEGHKVQVVAGFGRTRAVAWANANLNPPKPLKVLVRIVDLNAEEAFVRSIVENNDRTNTTPIDDAYAQRRLREEFNWPEQKIADFYKKSVAYIGQLRKTLTLSTELKAEVAAGNLPVSTAIILTDLPETERAAVVAEAKDDVTGKVDTEVVKKKVRAKKIETGAGSTALSLKEVRTFFEELTGPGESEAIRELSKKVLSFVAGKITEQQMSNALKKWTKPDAVPVEDAKEAA